MAFLIGQCCTDQIIQPDPISPDASGKNEIVPFSNIATLTLPWNSTRKNRFGDAASLQVYIIGDDGKPRPTQVEIIADNDIAPTTYSFNFGGQQSGIIVIT